MLRRFRSIATAAGLLVLVVFTAWLGLASFHHHGTAPACEICKVLHTIHAALPGEPPALERHDAAHRLPALTLPTGVESRASLHPGRSPPRA